MKTLNQLIKAHNLDPIQHWQTIAICRELLNAENQESSISNFGSPKSFEPEPIPAQIPRLLELFAQGHQIAFSTTQFHGDDGGSLYLAYLIKPAYLEQWEAYTEDGSPYIYLENNPTHFIEVWAGAY